MLNKCQPVNLSYYTFDLIRENHNFHLKFPLNYSVDLGLFWFACSDMHILGGCGTRSVCVFLNK